MKNFKQFNESIKDLLSGPTYEEIFDNLKDKPQKLLSFSFNLRDSSEYKEKCKYGIRYAIEQGANSILDYDIYNYVKINKLFTDDEILEICKKYYNIEYIIKESFKLKFIEGIKYSIDIVKNLKGVMKDDFNKILRYGDDKLSIKLLKKFLEFSRTSGVYIGNVFEKNTIDYFENNNKIEMIKLVEEYTKLTMIYNYGK